MPRFTVTGVSGSSLRLAMSRAIVATGTFTIADSLRSIW
jgi:hypothetical protein